MTMFTQAETTRAHTAAAYGTREGRKGRMRTLRRWTCPVAHAAYLVAYYAQRPLRERPEGLASLAAYMAPVLGPAMLTPLRGRW